MSMPGNRLRWVFPTWAVTPTGYLGLPPRVIVERGNLREYMNDRFDPAPSIGSIPTMRLPNKAWKIMESHFREGQEPATLDLRGPHQIVYFKYLGPKTTVSVRDSNGIYTSEFTLSEQETFYFERAAIHQLVFGAPSNQITLKDLKAVDLFDDQWCNDLFRPIAEVNVMGGISAALKQRSGANDQKSFDNALKRIAANVAPDVMLWKVFLDSSAAAIAAAPPVPQDQAPWDIFTLIVNSTWQMAAICGFGLVDGSQASIRADGDKMLDILATPSADSLVYRTQACGFGNGDSAPMKSNYVVVDPGGARSLSPPEATLDIFKVAPVTISKVSQSFTSSDISRLSAKDLTSEVAYMASGTLNWHQPHCWELGLEATEDAGPSACMPKTPERIEVFRVLPGSFDHLERIGASLRSAQLPFVDSHLHYTFRSFDGWDRVSPEGPIVQVRTELDYRPTPPTLDDNDKTPVFMPQNDSNQGKVTISRSTKAAWAPDEIMKCLTYQVDILRRRGEPRIAVVEILKAFPVGGSLYRIELAKGLNEPNVYHNGLVVSGAVTGRIVRIADTQLEIRLEDMTSDVARVCKDDGIMIPAGAARVVQNPDQLWVFQQSWAVDNANPDHPLSLTADILESVPTDKVEIVSYATRVRVGTNEGPLSNVVSVLKLPTPPREPPHLDVQLLGVDYYRRALIQVRFPRNCRGKYTIDWAFSDEAWNDPRFGGRLPDATGTIDKKSPEDEARERRFRTVARQALLGMQEPFQERILHDLIPLPEQYWRDRYLTIGVKQVDGIGQESVYSLAEALLEVQ